MRAARSKVDLARSHTEMLHFFGRGYYGRVERGQNTLHEAHDGGLPEQRSSAAPPRPNGWAQRSASADAPAFFCILQVPGLTDLWRVDAEKL